MASFYINRHSNESVNSQWIRYLQTNAYIRDIESIVIQNRNELQSTIQNTSSEQIRAIHQVCGALNEGFAEVSSHLKNINSNISELRGEISEMASMLDWKLTMLIEEQRVTNELLSQITKMLRIPDSQKQRVYHIEQGLKYLKSALSEGIDSSYFLDSFDNFKQAEKIEKNDYFTLNRIGLIYLYSKQFLNISLAEEYFLKSAREAFVEAFVGGTSTSNNLIPTGSQSTIYSENPFKVATAEAYIYAGRACYLQHKFIEAITFAGKAFNLVPGFIEAGFEQAKYLAANNQEIESVQILEKILEKDPYFSIKILQDPDLISKKLVLDFIENIYKTKQTEVENLINEFSQYKITNEAANEIIFEAKRLVLGNNFLSYVEAIKIIQNKKFKVFKFRRVWNDGNLVKDSGKLVEVYYTVPQFIKMENPINRNISNTKIKTPSKNTGCALQMLLFAMAVFLVLFLI
jgi:hypothetical protein